MRTSVELVPRSRGKLIADARLIGERFAAVETINVPDVRRFSVRSWEAAALTAPWIPNRIPHLRARDCDPLDIGELSATLERADVREVIVVAGDPPSDRTGSAQAVDPLATASALAKRLPYLVIYGALDPYAYPDDSALRANLRRKWDSGVRGFFSQPLFSVECLERCAALMPPLPVFWGLSPVTTAASRDYWERVNRVRFPAVFEATWAWNLRFARELMARAGSRREHVYLMPIRASVGDYVDALYPDIERLAKPTAAAPTLQLAGC
jgi:methylenetetrahydrofolate reductase (NADPH)